MGHARKLGVGAVCALLAASCSRRPHRAPLDAAQVGVVAWDLGVEAPPVTHEDVALVEARAEPTDASPPRRVSRRVTTAWRKLPRFDLRGAHVLGRWEDPPDFDEDGVPDPVVAAQVEASEARCTAQAAQHPCPAPGGLRALSVAFVLALSGESSPPDAGAVSDAATATFGRVLGARSFPVELSTRVRGFEFSEFAVALAVRTTLDIDAGLRGSDTLDVVDLFAGDGYDTRIGALSHHCARREMGLPVRAGSLAVSAPSWAPVVWRAASAHPFSGCATDTAAYDRMLGEALRGGVRVRVIETTPAGAHHRVRIVTEGLNARVAGAHERGDASTGGPLSNGSLSITDMARGCSDDRLRFVRDGRPCVMVISRDDAPLPGCAEMASPLDPAPPRPVALVGPSAATDGGADATRLVFSRAGALYAVEVPVLCKRGNRHRAATPWRGALPAGAEASTDGERVLIPHGDDLWLAGGERAVPYLLNPPGGVLPRTDIRAAVFLDRDTVAAVFGASLIRFSIEVPDSPAEIMSDIELDRDAIRQGIDAIPE